MSRVSPPSGAKWFGTRAAFFALIFAGYSWLLGPSAPVQAFQGQAPAQAPPRADIRIHPSQTQIDDKLPGDKEVDRIVTEYGGRLKKQMAEVIGRVGVDLVKGLGGGTLGAWVTQVIAERASQAVGKPVDAAFQNIGGMRRNISRGEVRVNTIFELMPFENEIVVFEMKGADLLAALSHLAGRASNDQSDAVSGARLSLCKGQILQATIHDRPIDPNKRYLIAATDFLVQGGSGYDAFKNSISLFPTGIPLRQALIESVQSAQAAKKEIQVAATPSVEIKCPSGTRPPSDQSLDVGIPAPGRARARVAVVAVGIEQSAFLASLGSAIAELFTDLRLDVLDGDLIDRSLTGRPRYKLRNQSTGEAAQIGSLLGVNYYLLISGEIRASRDDAGGVSYRGWCSTHLVDGISGRLSKFIFTETQATEESVAADRLILMHKVDLTQSVNQLQRINQDHRGEHRPHALVSVAPGGDPALETRQNRPPEVTSSRKPVYTPEADRAGVEATVEIEVECRENGTIGEVEVIRWAGFGLDEAAVQAARQLRFRPAMISGAPASTRQILVYNFRRREE